MQELDAGNYRSLTQMTADAVARLSTGQKAGGQLSAGAAEQLRCRGSSAAGHGGRAAERGPGSGGHHRRRPARSAGAKNRSRSRTRRLPKRPRALRASCTGCSPTGTTSGFEKVRKTCCGSRSWSSAVRCSTWSTSARRTKSRRRTARLQSQMEQAEKDVAEGKINVSNIEGYPNDYLAQVLSVLFGK